MSRCFASHRIVPALLAALFALPGYAQMASFKNFKRYPTSGQWQQELVGFRDGRAMGAPAITTSCMNPLDPKLPAVMTQAAKESAPNCTTRILNDQELTAEFESVCRLPSGVQTLHTQLRAIDDRTIASEMRSTMPGMPETLMKSKATYLGPCTAAAAAASKPSAADCAAMTKMRQDNEAAGGAAQCAQLPAQQRAQCEASFATGAKMMAAIEQQCR